MASFLTASLVLALLVFSSSVSAGQIIITSKPGEDATLPCKAAENRNLEAAEWKKTNQSFCLYRISSFGGNQLKCNNSRAHLVDVENGDVSLVLKNVKTDDTGTYECRIKETTNNRRKRSVQDYKPISIINLRVEAGINIGLIVGLSVFAVAVVGGGGGVFYKRSRDSSTRSQPPPAAADVEETLTGPDE